MLGSGDAREALHRNGKAVIADDSLDDWQKVDHIVDLLRVTCITKLKRTKAELTCNESKAKRHLFERYVTRSHTFVV